LAKSAGERQKGLANVVSLQHFGHEGQIADRTASGGGQTPEMASRALEAAVRWAVLQMPQMRGVMHQAVERGRGLDEDILEAAVHVPELQTSATAVGRATRRESRDRLPRG
jgi:hypothetical protein